MAGVVLVVVVKKQVQKYGQCRVNANVHNFGFKKSRGSTKRWTMSRERLFSCQGSCWFLFVWFFWSYVRT